LSSPRTQKKFRSKNYLNQNWTQSKFPIFKSNCNKIESRLGLTVPRTYGEISKTINPDYLKIAAYADKTIETNFRKFDRILSEKQKVDWVRFINSKMIPLIKLIDSQKSEDKLDNLEEEEKLEEQEAARIANLGPKDGKPFYNLIRMLTEWDFLPDNELDAGADITSICKVPRRAQAEISESLSQENISDLVEYNSVMSRNLSFNLGVTNKAIKNLIIDHTKYKFTVGELLTVVYGENDESTAEENLNINQWPYIVQYLGPSPNSDDDDLLVWDYCEQDIIRGTKMVGKSYRQAYHTTGENDGKPYHAIIKKNTVIAGKIKLKSNGEIFSQHLDNFREVIIKIRKEEENMKIFLSGALYNKDSQDERLEIY
jgi:hypothetical protein